MSAQDIAPAAAPATRAVPAHVPPEAWTFDPSGWRERGPVLLLALVAAGLSFHLGMYQLHWIAHVWDPLFGQGSERVLTSRFSKLFPVPDALIGTGGYLTEAALSVLGGRRRYRTRPWLVLLYGAAVIGGAGVGVSFALIQGAIVGHWCTLCLCNSLIGVAILVLSWPEVYAAGRVKFEVEPLEVAGA